MSESSFSTGIELDCSICPFCRHTSKRHQFSRCTAFPNLIPAKFICGEAAHLSPAEGDHGFQFELRPNLSADEFRMFEQRLEWLGLSLEQVNISHPPRSNMASLWGRCRCCFMDILDFLLGIPLLFLFFCIVFATRRDDPPGRNPDASRRG